MTYIPLTHEKAMQIIVDQNLNSLPPEYDPCNFEDFDDRIHSERDWYDREKAKRPFLKLDYSYKDGKVNGLAGIQKKPEGDTIGHYNYYIFWWPLEHNGFSMVEEGYSAETLEEAESTFHNIVNHIVYKEGTK